MNNTTSALFLPGTMCDHRLWQACWASLPTDVETNFLPLHTIDHFEALNAHIQQHLTNSFSHLIGFSMGAYYALKFALAYPHQIKSLVLIGTSAKGLPEEELKMREYALQYLREVPYNGISQARIRQMVHPSRMTDATVVDIIKAMDQSLGKEVLIQQLEATSRRISLMDQLAELDIPVMLIGAEEDVLVPAQDLLEMYHELSDGKLELIQNAGHMIPLEYPEKLAELLVEWFEFYD